MATRGSTNRALELFFQLCLKTKFRKSVDDIKKLYGIPIVGFRDEESIQKWVHQLRKSKHIIRTRYPKWAGSLDDYFAFQNDCMLILRKNGLREASGIMLLMQRYLLSGSFDFESPAIDNNASFFIDIPWPPENKKGDDWKKEVVRLWIYDSATLPSAKEYLKKHWKLIKLFWGMSAPEKAKKVQPIRTKNRILRILREYEKSRDELGLLKGETKDVHVSKFLLEKYNDRVTPSNVRKIYKKYKK